MWQLEFASALPDRIVTAAEVAEWTGGDESFIRNKVGIESRRFLSPDQNPLDLALLATTRGLERAGLEASDLDFIVFVTQAPDFRLPQSSSLLADGLGAKPELAAFDISLACSGWVYALSLANALALAEGFEAGLIVTCDPYSRAMSRNDRATVTVFGDAASATVMTKGGAVVVGKADYGTDGAGGMGLRVDAGGSRAPTVSIDDTEATKTVVLDDYRVQMDGRAILDFMQTRVPASVDRAMERNGVNREDVSLFVFHQASQYMLQLLARRMELDPDRVPIEINDIGNTVSSSIPIAMERLAARGQLTGKTVVSGFGVGLSWASNVLDFGD
ncbi:MAG: ketoacyl-ACP synthase III [Pseudomonadota bacterium]